MLLDYGKRYIPFIHLSDFDRRRWLVGVGARRCSDFGIVGLRAAIDSIYPLFSIYLILMNLSFLCDDWMLYEHALFSPFFTAP